VWQDPDGLQLEITHTQQAYSTKDYDLSLLQRTPRPEEDLFHPGHAAYQAALREKQKLEERAPPKCTL